MRKQPHETFAVVFIKARAVPRAMNSNGAKNIVDLNARPHDAEHSDAPTPVGVKFSTFEARIVNQLFADIDPTQRLFDTPAIPFIVGVIMLLIRAETPRVMVLGRRQQSYEFGQWIRFFIQVENCTVVTECARDVFGQSIHLHGIGRRFINLADKVSEDHLVHDPPGNTSHAIS
jgi:hypothetical protein